VVDPARNGLLDQILLRPLCRNPDESPTQWRFFCSHRSQIQSTVKCWRVEGGEYAFPRGEVEGNELPSSFTAFFARIPPSASLASRSAPVLYWRNLKLSDLAHQIAEFAESRRSVGRNRGELVEPFANCLPGCTPGTVVHRNPFRDDLLRMAAAWESVCSLALVFAGRARGPAGWELGSRYRKHKTAGKPGESFRGLCSPKPRLDAFFSSTRIRARAGEFASRGDEASRQSAPVCKRSMGVDHQGMRSILAHRIAIAAGNNGVPRQKPGPVL